MLLSKKILLIRESFLYLAEKYTKAVPINGTLFSVTVEAVEMLGDDRLRIATAIRSMH